MKKLFCSAVLLSVFCFCLNAPVMAADKSSKGEMGEREQAALINRNLKHVFPQKQKEAITDIGRLEDPDVIKDFGFVEKLVEIAKSTRVHPMLRGEALRTLLVLNQKGIGIAQLLRLLTDLVSDEDTPINVRYGCLGLISRMGDKEGMDATLAFNELKKLSKKRKLKPALVGRIYAAMGAFYKINDTKKTLASGLKEKEVIVRAGVFEGIQKYLEGSQDTDENLKREILRSIQKGEKQVRLQAIRALETMIENGAKFTSTTITKSVLGELLATGGDEEVRAAVRLLVYIADESVVDTLLQTVNKRKAELKFDTVTAFIQSFGAIINGTAEWSNKSSAKSSVDKIVKYFYTILNPNNPNRPPVEIVKSALFGLGMVRQDFDRTMIVRVLIKLLAVEKADDVISTCEDSLSYLTSQQPKRIKDPVSGVETPDIAAWEAWYEENKKDLKEGKMPE